MASAISFGKVADFGKILTIVQGLSQPDYSDKWQASIFSKSLNSFAVLFIHTKSVLDLIFLDDTVRNFTWGTERKQKQQPKD